MRCVFYQGRRNDFGCEGNECECGKHLILAGYEEPDARLLRRVRFLIKIESMQLVGCTFHVNDLDRDTWEELIMLKRARNWIDAEVESQRDRIRKQKEAEEKGMAIARKEMGIPAPGKSLFSK